MREPKVELFPVDIENIAANAYEAHTGNKWDDVDLSAKARWTDCVPDAIRGRHSQDGLPAIEAAIVKAWQEYVAPKAHSKKATDHKATEPQIAEHDQLGKLKKK